MMMAGLWDMMKEMKMVGWMVLKKAVEMVAMWVSISVDL